MGKKRSNVPWFWNPNGLRSLNNDGNILKFIDDIKCFEVFDVFVDHIIDNL